MMIIIIIITKDFYTHTKIHLVIYGSIGPCHNMFAAG